MRLFALVVVIAVALVVIVVVGCTSIGIYFLGYANLFGWLYLLSLLFRFVRLVSLVS